MVSSKWCRLQTTASSQRSTQAAWSADELAYDPVKGVVIVTNPNDPVPYIAVMSATNRTVMGKIVFPNVTELEQPRYNGADGLFCISVPSSGKYPGGSIANLDISTISFNASYPVPECIPAGIAFGHNQHLLITCSVGQIKTYGYAASHVMDVSTSMIVANISGIAGVDQVAFDTNANLYYASAYQYLKDNKTAEPFLAIVNGSSNTLIQSIATDNKTAHSVAVDASTGLMLVPVKSKGIVAYKLESNVASAGNTTSSSGSGTPSSLASGSASQSSSASSGAMLTVAAYSPAVSYVLLIGSLLWAWL
jgi:hypothetical protein